MTTAAIAGLGALGVRPAWNLGKAYLNWTRSGAPVAMPRTRVGRFTGPGWTRRGGYYGRFKQRRRRSGPYMIRAPRVYQEMKFFDAPLSCAATVGGTPVNCEAAGNASLNRIADGPNENQRIGRKAVIRSIHMKFQCNTLTTNLIHHSRFILFLDRQANGAGAAMSAFLETTDPYSFFQLSEKNRFTILWDKVITWNPLEYTTSNTQRSRWFTYNKKCNIPIQFNGTTGALSEIRSNNLNMQLVSSRTDATGDSIIGTCRLRFTDS